jgi:tRNA(Arg) A34 adenosine deaminase TadA
MRGRKIDNSKRNLLLATTLAVPLLASREGNAAAADFPPLVQPDEPGDARFIGRAFEMRRRAIESGDQAYGAVVVRNGLIVGQSPSRVVVHQDPTAHAEIEAIRDAAARLASRDLSGCTLYSSTHACPMCEAAAYWAGIERMVSGQAADDGGRPGLCA